MTDRRTVLISGGAAVLAAGAGGMGLAFLRSTEAVAAQFPITRSDEEWREFLGDERYAVLRREHTEPAFSSPLNDLEDQGIFTCAGCGQDLYSSATKFESGTGWPSFWDSLPGAVGTKTDYKLIYPRTEVHCARCGGHLGHIFEDGPPPTGLRHCLNGLALDFRAQAA